MVWTSDALKVLSRLALVQLVYQLKRLEAVAIINSGRAKQIAYVLEVSRPSARPRRISSTYRCHQRQPGC